MDTLNQPGRLHVGFGYAHFTLVCEARQHLDEISILASLAEQFRKSIGERQVVVDVVFDGKNCCGLGKK